QFWERLRRKLLQNGEVAGNATSWLKGVQLDAPLCHNQGIGRHLPGLAMDLQLKSIFEKRLEHGPSHHALASGAIRLGIDLVADGVDPGRSSLYGDTRS